MKLRVVMAADPYGQDLKNFIAEELRKDGYEVIDRCPDAPMEYSMAAHAVAQAVQEKEADRGVAICGTGMGVSIVCNKHRGVYAALVEDQWQAERSRRVNNTNVLCLGGMYTGNIYGAEIVKGWLASNFGDGDPEGKFKGEFERIPAMEEKLYRNEGRERF